MGSEKPIEERRKRPQQERPEVRARRNESRRLIQDALAHPEWFVQDVLLDTGDRVNEVAIVEEGGSAALHAWWQPERVLDHLEAKECRELAVAGFRIQQDRSSVGDRYVYLRSRRHRHLWVAYTSGGWCWSHASSLKNCRWQRLVQPHRALPIWDGWDSNLKTVIRESIAVALQALQSLGHPKPVIPDTVFSERFFAALKKLATLLAAHLQKDANDLQEFVNQLVVDSGMQYEAHISTPEGDIPVRLW